MSHLKGVERGTNRPKREEALSSAERRDRERQVRDAREFREAVNKGYDNSMIRRKK
jgi:hypothetical protein